VPQSRKRATIGSLEALVTQGRFDESGPQPVTTGVPPPTTSAPARPPVANPRRSTPIRGTPMPAPASASSPAAARSPAAASAPAPSPTPHPPEPEGQRDPTRSGLHKVVREESDSGVRRVRRPQTGSRPPVRSGQRTPGTGRQPVVTTGPLAAVAPDAASGRTFGHSVVSEQATRGGTPWVWLIALLVVSGLGYVAYTLLTSK
jgi:hypothetical protein